MVKRENHRYYVSIQFHASERETFSLESSQVHFNSNPLWVQHLLYGSLPKAQQIAEASTIWVRWARI